MGEVMMKIEQKFNNMPEVNQYLFVRGFLLSTNNDLNLSAFPFYNNWNKTEIYDGFYAYTHNLQKVHYVEVDGKVFFIFGHAYNPFTMEIDENKILERINIIILLSHKFQFKYPKQK